MMGVWLSNQTNPLHVFHQPSGPAIHVMPLPLTKHIRQRAFELLHHRIQPPQSDRLFAPLQPEYRGRWQTDLFRELGERHVPTLISQEFGELFVQW